MKPLLRREETHGVRVASEWLNSCSGCEISIIDMGERLLDVLQVADIVHIPALVDSKYFGQLGDQKHLCLPEAMWAHQRGVRNEEHLEVATRCVKSANHHRPGTVRPTAGSLAGQFLHTARSWSEPSAPNHGQPEAYPSRGSAHAGSLLRPGREDQGGYLPAGLPPHPDQVFNALVALVAGQAPERAHQECLRHLFDGAQGQG